MDVFIFGMLRSGTTMLTNLLTNAPEQIVLIEPGITRGDMGLHVKRQIERLGATCSDQEWLAVGNPLKRFQRHAVPHLQGAKWGVKEVNPYGIPELLQKYPPRKVLLVVRDIRDIVASAVEKDERLNSNISDDWILKRARDTYDCLLMLERTIPSFMLRVLHYERFVQDADYRQELSDWVGFSFSGDLAQRLDIYGRDYEAQRHDSTIGARSLRRYQKPGSERQAAIVETAARLMSDYQAHYGYGGDGADQTPAPQDAGPDAFLAQFGLRATYTDDGRETRVVGFVGNDALAGQSARSVRGTLPSGGTGKYRVVCFHTTDDLYASRAANLIASLNTYGIDHRVVPVEVSDSWEATCSRKAAFVREQWEQSDVPVVWLDADATVEAEPSLFAALDCDFAVHKVKGWELASGTLYFGKTELARALLDQWVTRCEADPRGWDQNHLQSAWCDLSATRPLRTIWLPQPYLQIFDAPRRKSETPVIMHWQASRDLTGKKTKATPLELTEQGKEQRSANHLWRSAEDLYWINNGRRVEELTQPYAFPEGFDVGGALAAAIDGAFPVLEVGCGNGRIASLFEPDACQGVDIAPAMIREARRRLPGHDLRLIDDGFAYPAAGCVLFYETLQHLDGAEAVKVLETACASANRVVIAEVMDSRWRRGGLPAFFNRDPELYILAMQSFGFRLVNAAKYTHARYDSLQWRNGCDSRTSFLTFDRG